MQNFHYNILLFFLKTPIARLKIFLRNFIILFIYKQEAHKPQRSPEYQRLYTELLSEGCIFAYKQPIYYNKNQQLYRKAASLSFNTIAINVKYIDREEENTYSL